MRCFKCKKGSSCETKRHDLRYFFVDALYSTNIALNLFTVVLLRHWCSTTNELIEFILLLFDSRLDDVVELYSSREHAWEMSLVDLPVVFMAHKTEATTSLHALTSAISFSLIASFKRCSKCILDALVPTPEGAFATTTFILPFLSNQSMRGPNTRGTEIEIFVFSNDSMTMSILQHESTVLNTSVK